MSLGAYFEPCLAERIGFDISQPDRSPLPSHMQMARSLLVLTALLGLSSFLTLTQAAATYDQDVAVIRLAQGYASQLQQDADSVTLTDDVTLQAGMGRFEAVLNDLGQLKSALLNATVSAGSDQSASSHLHMGVLGQ